MTLECCQCVNLTNVPKGLVLLSACKQLLDEVFVVSRIIKVQVGVTSQRLMLITLTQKPNLIIIVLLYIERKKWKSCFCLFTDGKQQKASERDVINRDLDMIVE